MEFLDRKKEMDRLNKSLKFNEGNLIVIWGRRRIGKTRLLIEWIQKNNGLYWTADESSSAVQRNYFAQNLNTLFPGFSDVEYPNWDALLRRIASEAKTKKWRGPLVIDELPYLVNAAKELPSILQRWIDHEAKAAGLTVVLSGSSQSMMQGLVTDYNAPLYGRAHELFKLDPLPIGYIGQALDIKSCNQMVEAYTLWGGVPKYWELAKAYKKNIMQSACQLILDPHSSLYNEPSKLLLEEIPSAIVLRPILDAIGMGMHRISEIAARLGQPATSLARPIARLQDLDLVTKEIPFGENEKSSKTTLYKIKDPFFRFWFQVVASKKSMLLDCTDKVREGIFKKHFPHLVSQTWEDICLKAFSQFDPLNLSIDWLPAKRFWKGNGPEWDVVTQSLDEKNLLIGEVKWKTTAITETFVNKTIKALKAKGRPPLKLNENTKVHYCIFLPDGELKKQKFGDNIHVITAVDLIPRFT